MGLYALFFKGRFRSCFQLAEREETKFRSSFFFHNVKVHYTFPASFRKPRYIPSADSLDIPHHQLKAFEVEHRNRVKTNVEQNQGPLKEGVSGVC